MMRYMVFNLFLAIGVKFQEVESKSEEVPSDLFRGNFTWSHCNCGEEVFTFSQDRSSQHYSSDIIEETSSEWCFSIWGFNWNQCRFGQSFFYCYVYLNYYCSSQAWWYFVEILYCYFFPSMMCKWRLMWFWVSSFNFLYDKEQLLTSIVRTLVKS